MANHRRTTTIRDSTHAIQYALRWTEILQPAPARSDPCNFVVAALGPNAGDTIYIPCFLSSRSTQIEDYLRRYYLLLTNFLLNIYSPNISFCCASKVAKTFVSLLHNMNTAHCCRANAYTSVHHVELLFQPFEPEVEMNRVLRESFEEAGRVKEKPATIESLVALVQARNQEEREEGDRFESSWSVCECVICMEEIETRKSCLRMPCSHLFHGSCLIKWLATSHACPLCRYEMPHA